MDTLNGVMTELNAILWHDVVLWLLLGTGVIFTLWSGFSQIQALTHGTHVLRGRYDDPDDPGAINHFQALSAALSATVGLGNIGGVALAIALGGPGAVFWMWVVGFFGMTIKLTEVTLSMLYRNTDDPDNPHGGPMWVVSKGAALVSPRLAPLGKAIGGVFCITLLVSTATGGNMFQAWNVAEITHAYFGIPGIVTGIVLAVLVAMVIIGGIKRIGAVAGRGGSLSARWLIRSHRQCRSATGPFATHRERSVQRHRGHGRFSRRDHGLRLPLRYEKGAVL